MGLFRKKKEVPQISEENELKAMRKDLREPEKPKEAPPENAEQVSVPESQDAQEKLLYMVAGEAEAQDHMDLGYQDANWDTRLERFEKAFQLLLKTEEFCGEFCNAGSDLHESMNRIKCEICECSLQILRAAVRLNDRPKGMLHKDFLLAFYPTVRNPDAMAHFARAHSRMMGVDDVGEIADSEWPEILYHYLVAADLSEGLEVDRAGVYINSCYRAGLCYKNGWGTTPSKENARFYLTKALNAGFDCQDEIDSLD